MQAKLVRNEPWKCWGIESMEGHGAGFPPPHARPDTSGATDLWIESRKSVEPPTEPLGEIRQSLSRLIRMATVGPLAMDLSRKLAVRIVFGVNVW